MIDLQEEEFALVWQPAVIDLGAHLLHGILTGVIYKHRFESAGMSR